MKRVRKSVRRMKRGKKNRTAQRNAGRLRVDEESKRRGTRMGSG